ncbi:MAG TPA: hypothetical protein VMG38_12960 [Trebonia sp.]|nr:hypothetical protein [Trebonia sp.]
MPGVVRFSYGDDLPLGVRGRPSIPERPPGKPAGMCRSYQDEQELGVRGSAQDRAPHKPVTNCRADLDDPPRGE